MPAGRGRLREEVPTHVFVVCEADGPFQRLGRLLVAANEWLQVG